MPTSKAQTRRRSTPTSATQVPIGLLIAARYCFQIDYVPEQLRAEVAHADAIARRLLTQPLGAETHEDDFPNAAQALLTDSDIYTKAAADAQTAIAHYHWTRNDPQAEATAQALIMDLTWPALHAGFLLGLCMGHRLRVDVSVRQEGGR